MDNLSFYFVYLGTLLLPALVALSKYRCALPEFRPMLAFSWILLALEICRVFFGAQGAPVFFSANFHYLIEVLFVCWIGWRWRIFKGRVTSFRIFLLSLLACWIAEKLIFGWIYRESWGRILFYVIIALLSLDFLHRAFFRESIGRQKMAILLFCSALGGFFLISAFLEIGASIMNLAEGALLQNLFYFTGGLGVLFNITILISYLCISTKQGFSLA
jgi:hypothetical protein